MHGNAYKSVIEKLPSLVSPVKPQDSPTRFSHKILPLDSPRGSELSEQGRNWNAVVSNGVLRQQSLQKVNCNSQCCRLACPLVEWVYETIQICHAVLTATNNLVDFLLYPHTNILACAQMMGENRGKRKGWETPGVEPWTPIADLCSATELWQPPVLTIFYKNIYCRWY